MNIWENMSWADMTNEEWRCVKGYEGLYMVSNLGRVKRVDSVVNGKAGKPRVVIGKIRKQRLSFGYLRVKLSKGGVTRDHYVHKLVATAFIKKIIGKDFVNHKLGVRHDNRVSQLEWVTASENVKHGFEVNGRIANNKGKVGINSSRGVPVLAINRFTGEEQRFESGNIATKELGLTPGSLHRTLTGQYKYTKVFFIKYA